MLAGEDNVSDHVVRGVQWLIERQNEGGGWEEAESTGNGFPNHFYLRYYLYPHCFGLTALGRFRARLKEVGRSINRPLGAVGMGLPDTPTMAR